MSTQQHFPQYATSGRPSHTAADGTITYVDSNGDTVQTSNTNIFNGLRLAGGEAFISSDEESSEDEGHAPYIPSGHHHQQAYAQSRSSSERERSGSSSPSRKSKKEKKEKKSKKSKKERAPEYVMAAGSTSGSAAPHICPCGGHGRH